MGPPRPICPQRLPHHLLEQVFSYLSAKDLCACSRVCRQWGAYLENEDCRVWKAVCERTLPEAALADPFLLVEVATYKSKLRAFYHAWNPLDCSRHVTIQKLRFITFLEKLVTNMMHY